MIKKTFKAVLFCTRILTHFLILIVGLFKKLLLTCFSPFKSSKSRLLTLSFAPQNYLSPQLFGKSSAELEKEIAKIQKSTKTTFKVFSKTHNFLRSKYQFYYRWHLAPYHEPVHLGVLASVIIGLAIFLPSYFLSGPLVPVWAINQGDTARQEEVASISQSVTQESDTGKDEPEAPFVSSQILVKVTEDSKDSLKVDKTDNPQDTGIPPLDKTNEKLDAKSTEKVLDETPKVDGKEAPPDDMDRWIVVTLNNQETVSDKPANETEVTVDGNKTTYQQVIDTYKQTPGVEAVSPNYIYYPSYVPNDTYASSSALFSGGRSDMWGLDKINAKAAWDVTTGNGEVVAVVDTGVDYNHPDLAANILRDGSNNVIGYDYANNDSDPMDDVGHGTHVAGIIAAVGDNDPNHAVDSGTRVVGAGYGLKIMPIKFMNSDGGTTIAAINSINFAVDHGATIINNSWSGVGVEDTALSDLLQTLHSEDIICVFAAGNSHQDVGYENPTGDPYVITVGSSNYEDQKSDFSDYGARVDLVAPGGAASTPAREYILSTISSSETMTAMGYPKVGSYYSEMYGTSMATPFVSVAAALIHEQHPTWSFEEVRFALRNSADALSGGWNSQTGAGRLNLANAVSLTDAPPTAFLDVAENTYYGAGEYSISGSVAADNTIAGWTLSYGIGDDPTSWTEIATGTAAKTGTLGELSVADYTGIVTLKLTATDNLSQTSAVYASVRYDSDLLPGWPKQLNSLFAHASLGDINNDGKNEIVIIDKEESPKIYALQSDGSVLPGFPVSFDEGNITSPTLFDIDQDGKKDIVVVEYINIATHNPPLAKLYVVKSNGQILSGWPATLTIYPSEGGDDAVFADPTVLDMNGDSKPEILVESYSSTVYAYQNNGQLVSGFPVSLDSGHFDPTFYYRNTTIAARDVNSDGKAEIFAGRVDSQKNGYVYGLDYQGNVLSGWPKQFDYEDASNIPGTVNIGLADINGDGQTEIIGQRVAMNDSEDVLDNIKVWTSGGQLLWEKDLTAGTFACGQGTPIFANVDGQPGLEILLTTNSNLYALDRDGNNVSGWPKTDVFGETSARVDLAAADINNDGSPEIIGYESGGTGSFSAIGLDGSVVWTKGLTNQQIEEPVVIGDVDNDGVLELVGSGSYIDNENTYIWKIALATSENNALPWPQGRGTARHDGVYPVSSVEHTVTIGSDGTGTGTFSPLSTQTVFDGDDLDITATPASTSLFTAWTGCDSTTGSVCHLTDITADKTVTVTFTLKNQYSVTISADGTGTGTFDQTSPVSVYEGDNLDITATAGAASRFDSWTGCTSVTDNVCHLTNIDANKTVTATFMVSAPHISGTVYTSADKSTNIGAGKTIAVSVNGVKFGTTAETDSNGAFQIRYVTSINANSAVAVYIDDETGFEANYITQAVAGGNTDITGLELYTGRIVLSHETTGPMTRAILNTALGGSPDGNIHYTTTGGIASFDTAYQVFIPAGKTFTPGTDIYLGDIKVNGTFSITNNNIYVSGSWDAYRGTFSFTFGTVSFTSTSSGETINNGNNQWYSLRFDGIGGGWSILGDIIASYFVIYNGTVSISGNMNVANSVLVDGGFLTGSGNITVSASGGNAITGSGGTINLSGGTVTVLGAGYFGGSTNDWTFHNLTFGNGTDSATVTKAGTGNVNVAGVLTITAHDTLNLDNVTWTLSGNNGTPLVSDGTLVSATSTVKYTGNNAFGNTNIVSGAYHNLYLDNSAETFAAAGDITVSNVFTLNSGRFDGKSYTLTLSGAGTPFVNQGTLIYSTSTVKYTGTGSVLPALADYYNLELKAGAVSPLVDSSSEALRNTYLNTGDGDITGAGQVFTGNSGSITSAKFFLYKKGSPTGNAYTKLYAVSGTFGEDTIPTGDPLAVSDPFDVSTLSAAWVLTTFTFSDANQYKMSQGTHYAIVFEYAAGNSKNNIEVGANTTHPDNLGNFVYEAGTDWAPLAPANVCFYVYASISSPSYTLPSGTIKVYGDFTVGDGTNGLTADARTNTPSVQVAGNFTVNDNATYLGTTPDKLIIPVEEEEEEQISAASDEESNNIANTNTAIPTVPQMVAQIAKRIKQTSPSISTSASAKSKTGDPISFDASDYSGSYLWNFGDGTTSTDEKVDHTFQKPGRYSVTMTVTDESGTAQTITKTVDVNPVNPTITNITSEGNDLFVEGQADPDTVVYLTFHSESPYIVSTVADSHGYWSYTLKDCASLLSRGDHTVKASAAVTLDDHSELRSEESKEYDFNVVFDNGELVVTQSDTSWRQYFGLLLVIILIIWATLSVKRQVHSHGSKPQFG